MKSLVRSELPETAQCVCADQGLTGSGVVRSGRGRHCKHKARSAARQFPLHQSGRLPEESEKAAAQVRLTWEYWFIIRSMSISTGLPGAH